MKHGKKAWQTKEVGPLPLSLTWGANSLKGQVYHCVQKIKEKKAGSFVNVRHG